MDSQKTSKSGQYWKEHLLSWEASAYFKDTPHKAKVWDRLSTFFRGEAMYVRMNTALDFLKAHIAKKTVLDVGCASGRFAFQLLEAGAAKVYGLDISPEAIQIAETHRAQAGLTDEVEFAVADIVHPERPFPETDLVTALGVIEYFDAQTMSTFLGNLRAPYFFLDFPDLSRRKEFPTWILRQVYIRAKRLPGVYLYDPQEFGRLAAPFGYRDLRVLKNNHFFFITNLPPS